MGPSGNPDANAIAMDIAPGDLLHKIVGRMEPTESRVLSVEPIHATDGSLLNVSVRLVNRDSPVNLPPDHPVRITKATD
jgi:hypothetical protein